MLYFYLDHGSYLSHRGILYTSSSYSTCHTSFTYIPETSYDQPKTFSLELEALQSSNPEQDVILDPSTVLIKITDKGHFSLYKIKPFRLCYWWS